MFLMLLLLEGTRFLLRYFLISLERLSTVSYTPNFVRSKCLQKRASKSQLNISSQ